MYLVGAVSMSSMRCVVHSIEELRAYFNHYEKIEVYVEYLNGKIVNILLSHLKDNEPSVHKSIMAYRNGLVVSAFYAGAKVEVEPIETWLPKGTTSCRKMLQKVRRWYVDMMQRRCGWWLRWVDTKPLTLGNS